jgi:hypothetical protein
MRNLILTLFGVLALTAVAAAPAGAETDTFKATATLTSKGNDAQGRVIFSGPISSPGFGKGTAQYLSTLGPDGSSITADFSAKFHFGSFKGTAAGTITPDPAGGSTLAGAGKITGGTRAYKGGKGKFTYTGHSAPDGSVTLTLKGKVTFPTK